MRIFSWGLRIFDSMKDFRKCCRFAPLAQNFMQSQGHNLPPRIIFCIDFPAGTPYNLGGDSGSGVNRLYFLNKNFHWGDTGENVLGVVAILKKKEFCNNKDLADSSNFFL